MAVWPPPLWYRTHWPAETAFMAMRGDAVIDGGGAAGQRGKGFPGEPRYRPVPLDSISIWLPRAAMIGEDNRFLEHGGIDYLAILEALGYRIAAYPLTLLSSAVRAMQEALEALAAGRPAPRRLPFEALQALVGFPEYDAALRRYAEGHAED